MEIASALPRVEPDGLPVADVGDWGCEKYLLAWNSVKIFSMALKRHPRVYVDLFSGPGYVQLRDSEHLVPGTPLLALMQTNRFQKYIFCDLDPDKISALRERVNRIAPEANVVYLTGDANDLADEIAEQLPSDYQWKNYCMVDPYGLNIHFNTLRTIAGVDRKVDFMVLLAFDMNARRAFRKYYTRLENPTIDLFLGNNRWREDWPHAEMLGHKIMPFLARQYIAAMAELGYRGTSLSHLYHVRSHRKGRTPLYHLAYFSRHPLGLKLWEAIKLTPKPQTELALL